LTDSPVEDILPDQCRLSDEMRCALTQVSEVPGGRDANGGDGRGSQRARRAWPGRYPGVDTGRRPPLHRTRGRSARLHPHVPGWGPTRHGSNFSPEIVEALEEFFGGGGDGDFELERSYVSGELAILVGAERQHGTVSGVDQDWSLRVTLAFRREDSGWRLVHRHADALVHPIDMEHLSRLARDAVVPPGGLRQRSRRSPEWRRRRSWPRRFRACALS
jgi:hypothetical protein